VHLCILGFTDFTKPFNVETDASSHGLGAILYQQQGDKKSDFMRKGNVDKNDKNYK